MSLSLGMLLRQAIARSNPGPLVVAFSGGGDSTALLHALADLDVARTRGLRALHVDHRLHPDSGRWAEHCARICTQIDVPFTTLDCTVDRHGGLGLEGQARAARYAALAAALEPGEWLATAQHREDQAETVLLRLLRASGSGGVAGMRSTRRLGAGTLWRPLLDCPRAVLVDYALEQQLQWIEDPANADPVHARSWLRREVLPLLRRRWPEADRALAGSAALLAADADLIAQQADAALRRCVDASGRELDIGVLQSLDATLQTHVLRQWLAAAGADPLPFHLHRKLQLEVIGAAPDAQPQLRYASTTIRRHRQRLFVDLRSAADTPAWMLAWDGAAPIELPAGRGWLQFEPAWTGGALLVAPRLGGEKILLPGRERRRSVKNLLRERDMPPWQRTRLPLLWSAAGQLLAVGDAIISAELHAWLRGRNGSYRWHPAEPPNGTRQSGA